MATSIPNISPQIWTCLNEVSTPNLRREDFFSALDVWITRPQVASGRFLGAISLSVETPDDLYLLANGYTKGEVDALIGNWGSFEIQCRRLLPKIKHYKPVEEFVLLDRVVDSVTFIPLCSPVCISEQFLTGSSYKLQFSAGDCEQEARIQLCCLTRDFTKQSVFFEIPQMQLLPSLNWLSDTLLQKIVRWGEESVGSDGSCGQATQQLISLEEYSKVYLKLKEKYAQEFIKIWPESTDPIKFVCEDIGIASYLIVLWGAERRHTGDTKMQSFLDLGCGNGLLTHLLNQEGHPGKGLDMRKRKIWSLYGENTNLEQSTFIPSEKAIFDSATDWVIGNHSDELTPWIPYIVSRSCYRMKYCVIPCCAYDFYSKFSKREGNLSLYRSYLSFVREVGEICGFKVEQDILRIPSTKKICLIGRVRSYNEEDSELMEAQRLKYLKSRPAPPPPPVPPKKQRGEETEFKPREITQEVRNCSKQPRELQTEVVTRVASCLIEMGSVGSSEWNVGGEMSVKTVVELFPKEILAKLKTENGGLQTLLKNHHQIFLVRGGVVKLRDWREEDGIADRKNSDLYKTSLCWFNTNHPQGCPLPADSCLFAHGDTDKRPRPKFNSVPN